MDSKYIKINSTYPFYLIIDKMNGYFQKIKENKYLALAPTNKSREIFKKSEELWSKIIDLIRSVTNNSDDYDKLYENLI